MKSSPLFIFVFSLCLSITAASGAVLISNDFDGVADDTGPSWTGYGWSGVSSGDPDTGDMILDTGATNYRAVMTTTSSVDVSSASSFTVTWNISGGTNLENIGSEGTFFGVTASSSPSQWRLGSHSFGLLIDSNRASGDWVIMQSIGSTYVNHTISGARPSGASLNDGFSVSLTLNSDDTFELITSGTNTDATTTGTLNVQSSYSDFESSLYPFIQLSGGGSPQITMNVDSATLTAIPEPNAFMLIGFAGLALLFRRRRS